MNLKLHFASLLTLGMLFTFVLSIVLAASFVSGDISWPFMVGVTLLFNFIVWLVSPYVSDLIYKWLYRATFHDIQEIYDKNPRLAQFIMQVCNSEKITVPRIGMIPDGNPTAFTYGSAPFNSRIVLTEGLFKYLNEDEVEAVVAHELGHIAHRDFIVMTLASTMLQLLYEMYVIFRRAGSRNRKGGGLVLIAYASFLLYVIGSYALLYLSRLREYYADEFAARKTGNPNLLASALLKVAYGIMSATDTDKTHRLLGSTRALGIFDFKAAKNVGLIYADQKGSEGLLEKTMLFDIVSPWAFLLELSSTHPLTGKRIMRLCAQTEKPAFDFERLSTQVDKGRLYKGFFTGAFFYYLPTLMGLAAIPAAFFYVASLPTGSITYGGAFLSFLGFLLLGVGAGKILKTLYKYPGASAEKSTVIEMLSDVYASPIHGRKVLLDGKVIGRGVPGYLFSEDMMFQDRTGLIYLNYESAIPLIGNLIFAWKKAEKLIGQGASAEGWFVRGMSHHLELKTLTAGEQRISSYVKALPMAFGMLLALIGIVLLNFALA